MRRYGNSSLPGMEEIFVTKAQRPGHFISTSSSLNSYFVKAGHLLILVFHFSFCGNVHILWTAGKERKRGSILIISCKAKQNIFFKKELIKNLSTDTQSSGWLLSWAGYPSTSTHLESNITFTGLWCTVHSQRPSEEQHPTTLINGKTKRFNNPPLPLPHVCSTPQPTDLPIFPNLSSWLQSCLSFCHTLLLTRLFQFCLGIIPH